MTHSTSFEQYINNMDSPLHFMVFILMVTYRFYKVQIYNDISGKGVCLSHLRCHNARLKWED